MTHSELVKAAEREPEASRPAEEGLGRISEGLDEEPCVLCEGTGWLDAFTECDLCECGGLMRHWKLPSEPHDCAKNGCSFGHGERCVYCGAEA